MSNQSNPNGPGASVNTIKALREANNQLNEDIITDGGKRENDDQDSKDKELTDEPEEPEKNEEKLPDITNSNDISEQESEPQRTIRSKFMDALGIGEKHVAPEERVKEITTQPSEKLTPEELAKKTQTFSSNVSSYDDKRTELEADIQARLQANETIIAEEAEEIAKQLKHAHTIASDDIEHPYDFNPERGEYTLGKKIDDTVTGEEILIPEDQYDFDISDEGLATYLSRVAEQGDSAMDMFSRIQRDMDTLRASRDEKEKELEALRNRNEDQLDSSRSKFTTEEEKELAESIKDVEDTADYADFEREVSEIDGELDNKRPRKEQHLAIGNTLLDEAQTTYESHASEVQDYASSVSEELNHLTDALENLTSAEIGEMDKLLSNYLEDHDNVFEGSGKHHSDAEGLLRDGHRNVVSALGVKIAQQYAQGQKSVDELKYLEDVLEDRTDRLDLGISSTTQEIIDQSYEGEEFETYLDEQMTQVLDDEYSAREDIRNIFKGLEALRDNKT